MAFCHLWFKELGTMQRHLKKIDKAVGKLCMRQPTSGADPPTGNVALKKRGKQERVNLEKKLGCEWDSA
jgi:hypothetical protein